MAGFVRAGDISIVGVGDPSQPTRSGQPRGHFRHLCHFSLGMKMTLDEGCHFQRGVLPLGNDKMTIMTGVRLYGMITPSALDMPS